MNDADRRVTSVVMMVRPDGFDFNPETAASNAFMHRTTIDAATMRVDVRRAFDDVVDALTTAGVEVLLFDDTDPPNPDAVFPNNWLTTHDDGRLVLYPMAAVSRRAERRHDLIDALERVHGFRIRERIDLSGIEVAGEALEGTGSLVLDRATRCAYMVRSARSTPAAAAAFSEAMDYAIVAFDAHDANGAPIYHTNVMMCIGTSFAIVTMDAIREAEDRRTIARRLDDAGLEIIAIDVEQMASFAGNALCLRGGDGSAVIAMSTRAAGSLQSTQRSAIELHARLVTADVSVIEHVAGGGLRCMLAEVFLPRDG